MSMHSHMGSRRGRSQGFTLVEMMIAIVIGSVAIMSIYYVSAASARHFHEQQRVAQTQMSLRMAMGQIRRDVARAGYMGSPNARRDQTCVTPAFQVQAIQVVHNDGTGELTESATNMVEADRLVLMGNYVTGDAYLSRRLNAAGNTITLQNTWQAYRRSFGDPFEESAFSDVFQAGRLLRLQNVQGNNFFVQITGATPAAGTINISPSLPLGACLGGLADGALVSPIVTIEYSVMNMTEAAIEDLSSPASPLAGVNGPVLVRRELDAAGAPIAGTERVVLEYVADFDVDVVADNQTVLGAPPILAAANDAAATALTATTAAGFPHRVRIARVRLSARSAAEDPRFPYVARGAGNPLTRYELSNAVVGAARVRTMNAEILIPNVAERGIRP